MGSSPRAAPRCVSAAIHRADQALYQAKRAGRNRVVALEFIATPASRPAVGLDFGPAVGAGMEPTGAAATRAAMSIEP